MRRGREETLQVWYDTPFGSTPQNGYLTFHYVHIVFACVHSRLYLVTTPSLLTFKPKSSLYFRLVSDIETYPFSGGPTPVQKIWDLKFFSSDFELPLSLILYIVKWFHIFLSNTNFQIVLFNPLMRPEQVQSPWVRVDLGVMEMKYSILQISLEQEPHYQVQFSIKPRTSFFRRGVTHQQGIESAYSKSFPMRLDGLTRESRCLANIQWMLCHDSSRSAFSSYFLFSLSPSPKIIPLLSF